MNQIPSFSNLKFGDHCCLFYDSIEQQVSVVVSFMQAGLNRNERCVCVLDPETLPLARKALLEGGVDVGRLEHSGAIVLSSARDFLDNGYFHAGKMIQFLQAAIDESKTLKFDGLRATGDMTWEAGQSEYDGFIEYEATLDRFFDGKSLIGMCQYNRNAFDPDVLENAFRTHRSVVIDTQYCPNNLFYNPPEILKAEGATREAKRVEWMRMQVKRLAAAEAERDAIDRKKDEFLMTLSHELRTPLTPVLGWTHLIRSHDFDKQTVARGMDVIERNINTEISLVNDLLDLSRIITGKFKLDVSNVNLPSLLDTTLDVVRSEAKAKSIEIKTTYNAQIDSIPGDPARLQQVFWNLLKNAVKFTPFGGNIDVTVSSDGTSAKIAFRDNGEGIDENYLPQVFNRFNLQDGSTTRKHGGLGIGLSIVKNLVELHHGKVQAQSAGAGRGSTFTVWLPLTINTVLTPEKTQPRNQAGRLSGARVLVVDDDGDTLEYLSRALQQAGATVKTTPSVSEALDVIKQFNPSILISDIGMPDEDGYSLMRRLRSSGHSIPAVALSAHARDEDRDRSLGAGFSRHVPKPIDPDALVEVIVDVGKSPVKAAL